jgi:hypothetical protein
MRFRQVLTIMVLVVSSFSSADAQALIGSILHVEIANSTLYRIGFCTLAEQQPTKLPAQSSVVSFGRSVGIGDIVSVNGQAVKGVAVEVFNGGALNTAFTPGQSIADITLNPLSVTWELVFLNPDGTPIGTVHVAGNGGLPPPGAPKEIIGADWTVTGGTGPFFGARGYWSAVQDSISKERQTSDCEDPAYRRINADPGGNKRHGVLYLVPLTQPQILATPNGPAVIHSNDGSLVTAAKPAKAGEVLTLFASGLGPTRPGVDPGQPFPLDPLQIVNSPIQVLVNGSAGDILYAGGYPGAVDGFQVNFRVPSGATPGQAALQLTSAWILGPAVNIAVQ